MKRQAKKTVVTGEEGTTVEIMNACEGGDVFVTVMRADDDDDTARVAIISRDQVLKVIRALARETLK